MSSIQKQFRPRRIKEKLSEDDINSITDKSTEIQNRLDEDPDVDLETLESWMKELQDIVNPIMTQMYQGAGGDPSAAGKMPEICQAICQLMDHL